MIDIQSAKSIANDMGLLLLIAIALTIKFLWLYHVLIQYIQYREEKKQKNSQFPYLKDIYSADLGQLMIWINELPPASSSSESHKMHIIHEMYQNLLTHRQHVN